MDVPEKPRMLKDHLDPRQDKLTNSTQRQNVDKTSDIKCNKLNKLNAITNSPLVGKTEARERGSVQKGRQLEI